MGKRQTSFLALSIRRGKRPALPEGKKTRTLVFLFKILLLWNVSSHTTQKNIPFCSITFPNFQSKSQIPGCFLQFFLSMKPKNTSFSRAIKIAFTFKTVRGFVGIIRDLTGFIAGGAWSHSPRLCTGTHKPLVGLPSESKKSLVCCCFGAILMKACCHPLGKPSKLVFLSPQSNHSSLQK